MFTLLSHFSLFFVASILAAPCPTMLEGNLSPNGVNGNFQLIDGQVVFVPNYLETGFFVTLKSCQSPSVTPGRMPSSMSGQLLAPNGQCLAVKDDVLVAVDCSDTTLQDKMTWTYNSFLYWNGPQNSTCPSGLYGYQVKDSSGYPSQVQNAPLAVGCESSTGVFPFSVLM